MNKFMPTNPTIQMVCDYIKNNQMSFDNPVQRGLVWDKAEKSLLIHSILIGIPIQPIYANRIKFIYDVIDGQQRCTTFHEFINGGFALIGVPDINLENGEVININGCKYDQLPNLLQSQLLTYTIILYYAENLSQKEVQEIYIRLNNGKPLSPVETIKAQTLDVVKINKLSEHKLFDLIMNKKSRNASSDIGFVQQSYMVLFSETFCLRKSNIIQVMKTINITDDQIELLNELFNLYYQIFILLKKNVSHKKPYNLLKKKIHFVSLIPVLKYGLENGIDYHTTTNWIINFFSPINETTINVDYNDNLSSSTNSSKSVQARINAAQKDFEEFIVSKGDIQLTI